MATGTWRPARPGGACPGVDTRGPCRSAFSDDLPTRLAYGPALTEPIGSAMDRRVLLGIKERAERTEAS